MNAYLTHRLNPKHDRIKILTTTKKHEINIHLANKCQKVPHDPHLFNFLNSQPFSERKYRDKNNQPIKKKYQKKINKITISNDNRLISSWKNILPVEKFCSRLTKLHMLKTYSILKHPCLGDIVLRTLLLNSLTYCNFKWPLSRSFDLIKRNSNLLLKGLAKQATLKNLKLKMKLYYPKVQTQIVSLLPTFQQLRSLSISFAGLITMEFISTLGKTLPLAKSLYKLKIVVTKYASQGFNELILLFYAISESNIKHLYCNMSRMTFNQRIWQEIALGVEKCIQLENLNLLIGEINEEFPIIENLNDNTISKCYSKAISRLQKLKELIINWDIFTYFSCSNDYNLPNLEMLIFRGSHLDLNKKIEKYRSIVTMMPNLKKLELYISNTKFEDKEKLYLTNTIFESLYRFNEHDNLPDVFLTIGPYANGVDKVILTNTEILVKNKTISLFKSLDIALNVADAPNVANLLSSYKNLENLYLALCNWEPDNTFQTHKLGDLIMFKFLKSLEITFNGRLYAMKTDEIVLKLLKHCMNLKTLKMNLCQFAWQLQDDDSHIFFDLLSEILNRNPLEELSLIFSKNMIWSKTTISHFIKTITNAKTLKTLSLPGFSLDGPKKYVLTKFISYKWNILHGVNSP